MPARPGYFIRRTDGAIIPLPPGGGEREITINGVRYDSMAQACRELKCSYRDIYRALGEMYRYAAKKNEPDSI